MKLTGKQSHIMITYTKWFELILWNERTYHVWNALNWFTQGSIPYTLQETNISPQNGILKMIFLFPRWDMLIPWRVYLAWPPPFNRRKAQHLWRCFGFGHPGASDTKWAKYGQPRWVMFSENPRVGWVLSGWYYPSRMHGTISVKDPYMNGWFLIVNV